MSVFHDDGRFESGEELQPEACRFRLLYPKHPRLNELSVRGIHEGLRVAVGNRVLHTDHGDRRMEECVEESHGLEHLLPSRIPFDGSRARPVIEMLDPCIREVGAGGMEDAKVPAFVEMLENGSMNVEGAGVKSRSKVTTPGVMSSESEGLPHHSRKFTPNEDSHRV